MRHAARHDLTPEDLRGRLYAQYVRDSTKDQAEGYGPDIQRRANRAFAERYGLIDSGLVYEEYVSGGSIQRRHELIRAVADMRAGQFTVLLVGWTHRFARSTEDAARVKREIMEVGGVLVYTAQGIVSGQKSSRVGEKVLHVLDEEYRENLSDLMSNALHAKFQSNGANGRPPLGSRHVYIRRDGTIAQGPERQTLAIRVLDERELPLLRALLTHYVRHGSYRKTAEWLNGQGYRTRACRIFTFDSVKEIVRNPFYGPEEIVWYHPGRIDEERLPTPEERRIFPDDIHELWTTAQAKRDLAARRSTPSTAMRIYPLHSVLRCQTCGSTYHGQTNRGLRVSRHAAPDRGCVPPRTVPADLLEDQLAEALTNVVLPESWQKQIVRVLQQPAIDPYAEERKQIERRIERLRYQHLCEAIDDATFQREFRALKSRLARIPAPSQTSLRSYREPAELLASVGTIVGHPAVRRREDGRARLQQFCALAFRTIQVSGRRLVTVEPRPRYAELFAIALANKDPVERAPYGVGTCAAEGTRTPTPFTGTWT